MYLQIKEEVQEALLSQKPVVALESTVIAHGLPFPRNVETALAMEEKARENNAIPATCAVLGGILRVGLSSGEIEELASAENVQKSGARDLAWLVSQKLTGATTVSGTLQIATKAKIRLFASGGIGGIHRGLPIDISADLYTLARSPVALVASGVKSILDVNATLEAFEALSIPVLGMKTSTFPRFYVKSGPKIEPVVNTEREAAGFLKTHFQTMQNKTGVFFANPSPMTIEEEEHESAVKEALSLAKKKNISGKASTPFLLKIMRDILGDSALEANIQLLLSNAETAAKIALEYQKQCSE